MLQAADISFSYRPPSPPVLRGVSLDVPAGGFAGILGPNGSGKSTLLRVLAGTLRPTAGRVLLDGTDVSRMTRTEVARRMAVVPQETHLAFDFTALEVVLMGRYPHLGTFEVEGPADIAIAQDALSSTGTAALANRPFATLSGGEKQRVIIAGALAQLVRREENREQPSSLLLLDEPTAALDLAYQLEVAALLRDLQRRRNVSIVISTHDLNFAAGLCRTLLLLKEGQVLAAGLTADVLTPSHIRSLYGVDAEVRHHPGAGHVVVVPLARAADDGPAT